MAIRDGYSNFKFFQALLPQVTVNAAKISGISVDTLGYDTCTFAVNVGGLTSGGATGAGSFWKIMLEHYNSVALAWSEVYPSQMLHSVTGDQTAYSALNSGCFQSISSYTDASQVYVCGYKGPHRLVRVAISDTGAPSLMSLGCVAILGKPNHWPVNSPA